MLSTKLFGKSDICKYSYRSRVTEKTMKKYVKKDDRFRYHTHLRDSSQLSN